MTYYLIILINYLLLLFIKKKFIIIMNFVILEKTLFERLSPQKKL